MIDCRWNGCAKLIAFNDIQKHMGSHIGYSKQNTFYPNCKWPGCTKSKATRGELLSHVMVHFNTRPYICKCGKAFKRKYDRSMHAQRCMGSKFYDILNELFHGLPGRKDILNDSFQ